MYSNRDTFCVQILNYQIMKAHTHNLSNMKIKTFILTVLVLLSGSACKAQYNQYNSFMRKALVIYKCGPDGYYHATKNVTLDEVKDVETQYAYNKKTQNLYVLTPNSNCEVTLTKEYAKIFKKSKDVRQLKDEELEAAIEEQNRILEQKFKRLNDERTRHIEDSIAKAKRDSIERARQDSIARVREAEQLQSYRETHDWRRVPVKGIRLKCEICDETTINEDSLYCIGINNDSIMYFEWKEGKLDNEYLEWHISSLPMELKGVVEKATAEDPEKRYATVEAMRHAINARRNMRRSGVMAAVALTVALIIVGLFFYLLPSPDPVEYVQPVDEPIPDEMLEEDMEALLGIGADADSATIAAAVQR